MERVTEPELMDDEEQARAYSEADFATPHQAVVAHFVEHFPEFEHGRVLDLACGPADVTTRLAHALPRATFVGVDGADAMITLGRERVANRQLTDRVALECRVLPDATLREVGPWDAVVCSGALHHFHDPLVLWNAVRDACRTGTRVLVQDLVRPATDAEAHAFVDRYADGEPELLRRDYLNSLRAAFTLDEIRAQLDAVGFGHFSVDAVSDRHVVVTGRAR